MSINFADKFLMSKLIFLMNYQLYKNILANKNPPNFKNEVGGFLLHRYFTRSIHCFLFGKLVYSIGAKILTSERINLLSKVSFKLPDSIFSDFEIVSIISAFISSITSHL